MSALPTTRLLPWTILLTLGAAACGTVEETGQDPDATANGQGEPDASGGGGDPDGSSSGENQAPEIANITLSRNPVEVAGETSVTCDASDPDGDELLYTWQVDKGQIDGSERTALWSGLEAEGTATLTCTVDDQNGETDSISREVDVAVAPGALVAHYPFDNSGQDASGNEHHIDSISGPEFAEDRFGEANAALAFGFGENDSLTLPDEAAFDFSSLTIAVWIKREITKANQSLVSKGANGLGNFTLRVRGDSATEDPAQLEYGHATASGQFLRASGSEVSDGLWLHVAVSMDASGLALFVNGVEQTSSSSPPEPVQNDADVLVGANVLDEFFAGVMDDLRIYDRALTEAEVSAIVSAE